MYQSWIPFGVCLGRGLSLPRIMNSILPRYAGDTGTVKMQSCFLEGKPRFLVRFVFLLQGIEKPLKLFYDKDFIGVRVNYGTNVKTSHM